MAIESLPPLLAYDRTRSEDGRLLLAGVDEAGRGCWAGPVVAAAVILPDGWCPTELNDSKKLSAKRREKLCGEVLASALTWGACAVSAQEIDRINILQATLQGMQRSLAKLGRTPELVLVDGMQVPDIPWPAEAVVKGDGTSACIAAASILAKVFRDRIMTGWGRHYPAYGFAGHKGYGVPVHQASLASSGPCAIHRLSYKPVANWDADALF
ncbi:MAG: ribonuclease HII [Candidatus Krumholzibacteriia bacterium]